MTRRELFTTACFSPGMKCCGTCAFAYIPDIKYIRLCGDTKVECRRNPPAVVTENHDDYSEIKTQFPELEALSGWCSLWEACDGDADDAGDGWHHGRKE